MVPYRNLSGRSGVLAYELRRGAITVAFADAVYVYTEDSAGVDAIAHMQALARAGRGLSTYIAQHARMAYATKSPVQ